MVVITKKDRIGIVHSAAITLAVDAIGVEDGDMRQGSSQFDKCLLHDGVHRAIVDALRGRPELELTRAAAHLRVNPEPG